MAETETRIIKYGDRELPMPEGMTLAQAKELMSRHFPELADPDVKTDKKGETTVYTFAKKAGTKGGVRPPLPLARLAAIPPHPVIAQDLVAAVRVLQRDGALERLSLQHIQRLTAGVGRVFDQRELLHDVARGLAELPNAAPPTGSLL